MPSVDNALLTLLSLADHGPTGASLACIADELGRKKSSLHATLAALRYRGFVSQQQDTGFYRLGPAFAKLSRSFNDNMDVPLLLRPAVRRLAGEINEVVHVAVIDGTDVVYVDKVASRRPIQPGTSLGLRLPAATTALGRALISQEYADFDSFATRFKESWNPQTPKAPVTLEDAWEPILEARRAGYALDLEANVEGLTALAIAILREDTPVAAVSVVGLAADTGPEGPVTHLEALRGILDAVLELPYRLARPRSN
jgi:DNA-binding IclR family transcriptional regulator